jgi:nucleosome binding factor SPN SPT16 subunit
VEGNEEPKEGEEKRERERGMNFDVVQVRVELQKIRDQRTQGACEVSLRPRARTRRLGR